MIHSLAGGNIGKEIFSNFAFVEIIEGENVGKKYWYITKIIDLKSEDIVLVPYGISLVKARVIRVDKNVSSFSSPIPIKRAKQIIKKV